MTKVAEIFASTLQKYNLHLLYACNLFVQYIYSKIYCKHCF